MANATRERLEAMEVDKVAQHYGLKPEIVAAYRALQLGRRA